MKALTDADFEKRAFPITDACVDLVSRQNRPWPHARTFQAFNASAESNPFGLRCLSVAPRPGSLQA